MRSKFFVRAVKRGDYDPEWEEDDWGHTSALWVRQYVSYFWGPRGDAKPWPKSRMLPPLDVTPCRWDDEGRVTAYLWRPRAKGRKLYSEYSRRRKNR
jgi:hypothetical protein